MESYPPVITRPQGGVPLPLYLKKKKLVVFKDICNNLAPLILDTHNYNTLHWPTLVLVSTSSTDKIIFFQYSQTTYYRQTKVEPKPYIYTHSTQNLLVESGTIMDSQEDPTVTASSLASQICTHIASIFSNPTHPYPPPLDLLVSELTLTASQNGRVFLYGVGREGLMLKGLCMRLAHLGLSAHFVFDLTTPPITARDLLVASAGPGGFSTVEAICSVARSYGGRVLLLTAQPETGSCVKYASVVAYVAAQTMADDTDEGEVKSRALLPMGSVYEGALFVLFESVVYKLGEALGESPQAVRSRHTNLE